MSAPIAFRALGAADIHKLLTYDRCIAAVERAMSETSKGRASLPLRQIMPTPGGAGWLGVMPGAMESPANFGVKLISLYPGNPAIGLSSHLGLYILYEAEHGRPLAVLEAGALTAIRRRDRRRHEASCPQRRAAAGDHRYRRGGRNPSARHSRRARHRGGRGLGPRS